MDNIISFLKKKRVVISIIIIFVLLFIVIGLFFILKKGTFGYNLEGDRLIIDCPNLVNEGDTVSCMVSLEMADNINVLAVLADYDLSENLTLLSFETDNTECSGEGCFSVFDTSDSGFTVTNNNGILGGGYVGTIMFTMPNDLEPNSEFIVGLKNIKIGYQENGEDTTLDLNDASTTVRTPDVVATLASLSISGVSFNQTFSSINLNYTANVPSNVSSITFNYETTSTHATVSGNGILNPINLSYGHNVYNFIVKAEDGETSFEYTVDVFREYEFSSSAYNYLDEYNIIYTGPDTEAQIISKLADLADGLHYDLDLDENKLYILREDDSVVTDVNVVRFGTQYSISNNKFYLSGPLAYSELIETVQNSNVSIRLYNHDNQLQEDTSTMITEGDILKVYYNEELLASYEFVDNSLGFASSLVRDDENNVINRVPADITVAEFKDMIIVNGEIEVFNLSNEPTAETDIVGTGYTVSIDMVNETLTYTISVLGDINGDGQVYINDVGMVYRYYMGYLRTLSRAQVNAGDIINDGEVYINDIGRLYRYYMNYESSLEVLANENE